MKGDLGHRTNGTDHLLFVPGVGLVVMDPRVRNSLLMLDFEGEALASTGPLPHGLAIHYSARACAAPDKQPEGLGWVKSLTKAVVEAWTKDGTNA